jgi:predicted outer membrane repeat protein
MGSERIYVISCTGDSTDRRSTMSRTALGLITVGIALIPVSALADTWYITPDGTGDAPTIQAGIDSADAGDEVVLADGTYTGDGNRDVDYLGKAVTVRSESGDPDLCVIDCEGSEGDPHRGFYLHTGEGPASCLDGVTVTGGYREEGGGVRCVMTSPTITNCVFQENRALYGGGIYAYGDVTVARCKFLDCYAGVGAGILIDPGDGAAVSECIFTGNTGGYALHVFDCTPSISNCTLYRNERGIGVEFYGANPVVESTIVAGTLYGAAVECEPTTDPHVTLICCDLYGNSGGGWVGCIADQYGISGNFSDDPRFCDAESGDVNLDGDSPCAPGNSPSGCGLIGARPAGCAHAGVDPDRHAAATWGAIKSMYR